MVRLPAALTARCVLRDAGTSVCYLACNVQVVDAFNEINEQRFLMLE
jgi:hypothetical protein